jgi:DNA-directed RNA polymerase specialized sigma24 family protein
LSCAEAADVLGMLPKAVEQHMMRAFRSLRVRLAQWRN